MGRIKDLRKQARAWSVTQMMIFIMHMCSPGCSRGSGTGRERERGIEREGGGGQRGREGCEADLLAYGLASVVLGQPQPSHA